MKAQPCPLMQVCTRKRSITNHHMHNTSPFPILSTIPIICPLNYFLPLDPANLEELAKERLSENGWRYASSNAGQSHTHTANRQAFYRHRIIPRMLVDTNTRDTAASIFGHRVSAPIGFAPIGINKIYHSQGELPVAKVAAELGLPYCLSTAGSNSIEDVAKANGNGLRFFQLYMPHDDELTVSLLKRAYESGFEACILTVDTWQLGWRHDDVATSNYAFYHGIGADLGLSDPVFQKRLKERGINPKTQPNEAGALWIDNVWHGRAHTWEKVKWVMGVWKDISGDRPFCLKGIQSVEDAKKAVDLGCHGIVVSNHAGRQVDGAVASLDALVKIVDGKCTPTKWLLANSCLLESQRWGIVPISCSILG